MVNQRRIEGMPFPKGHRLSERHKRRISAALKGREFSEEWRRKISAAHKGRVMSARHRRKLSAAKLGNQYAKALTGIPKSAEHRRKIGEGNRRRWEKWRLERQPVTIESILQKYAPWGPAPPGGY